MTLLVYLIHYVCVVCVCVWVCVWAYEIIINNEIVVIPFIPFLTFISSRPFFSSIELILLLVYIYIYIYIYIYVCMCVRVCGLCSYLLAYFFAITFKSLLFLFFLKTIKMYTTYNIINIINHFNIYIYIYMQLPVWLSG